MSTTTMAVMAPALQSASTAPTPPTPHSQTGTVLAASGHADSVAVPTALRGKSSRSSAAPAASHTDSDGHERVSLSHTVMQGVAAAPLVAADGSRGEVGAAASAPTQPLEAEAIHTDTTGAAPEEPGMYETARLDALAMTIRLRSDMDEDPVVAARVMARRLGAGLVKRPAYAGGSSRASSVAASAEASTTLLLANGSPSSRRGSFATLDVSLNATRRWRSTVGATAVHETHGSTSSKHPRRDESASARYAAPQGKGKTTPPPTRAAAASQLPRSQPPQKPSQAAGAAGSDRRGQRVVTMLADTATRTPPSGNEPLSVRESQQQQQQGRRAPHAGARSTPPLHGSATASCERSANSTPAPLIEREYTEAELEENPALRQLTSVWRKLQLANAIVAEANDLAPVRPVRTEAQRQAELMNLERAKLILFVGRKYNLEQTLEELLEVRAAQEKARAKGRRKKVQGTPLPTPGGGGGGGASAAASPDDRTSSADTSATSNPAEDEFSRGTASRGPAAAEQLKKLRQLNANFFSKHTLPEEDLSLRELRRLVDCVDDLVEEAQAHVTDADVSAQRKQSVEARGALSNHKDVMWLIESVDLALVSELDVIEPLEPQQWQRQASLEQVEAKKGMAGADAVEKPAAPARLSATLQETEAEHASGKDESGGNALVPSNDAATVTADGVTQSHSAAAPSMELAKHARKTSHLSVSTPWPSVCEPSVVPFSLLEEGEGVEESVDAHQPVAAAVADVKRVMGGLAMLDFMLDAIPETYLAGVDQDALLTGRPTTADTTGLHPRQQGTAAEGAYSQTNEKESYWSQSSRPGSTARDNLSQRTGLLPATRAASTPRLSNASATSAAATRVSRGGAGGLSGADGSDGFVLSSDASSQAGSTSDQPPYQFGAAGVDLVSLTQMRAAGKGTERTMQYHPIRADLLSDLKRLYPQFDYERFIEARRANRQLSLTQKSEGEYIAEMEDALRRHREESASRRAGSPGADDAFMESLLGNIGKRSSAAGNSRATSAASRSAAGDGRVPSASQDRHRGSGALDGSQRGSGRGSTSVPPALPPGIDGTGTRAPREGSASAAAAAAAGRPPLGKANDGETILFDETLPCGLRCTVVGKSDLVSKAAGDAARTEPAGEEKGKKTSKKGKAKTGSGKASGGAGQLPFHRYEICVHNQHTYSAAVAVLRLIHSKLPGVTTTVDAGVEAVRPTELRKMLQPGQTQRFATLVPITARQKRAGSIVFKDALLFQGELSNGFDTFSLLRPRSGMGSGSGSHPTDDLDNLSMHSDDVEKFASIPPVPAEGSGQRHQPAPFCGVASYGYQPVDDRPASTASHKKLPAVKQATSASSKAPTRVDASSAKATKPTEGPTPSPPPMEQYVFPPPSSAEALAEDPGAQAIENNLVALTVVQMAAATPVAQEGAVDALLAGVPAEALPDVAAQMVAHLAKEAGAAEASAELGSASVATARPGTDTAGSRPFSSPCSRGRPPRGGSGSSYIGALPPPGASSPVTATSPLGRTGLRRSSASIVSGTEGASGLALQPSADSRVPSRPASGRAPSAPPAIHMGSQSPPTILIASAHSRPLTADEASSFSSPGGVQFDTDSLRMAVQVTEEEPADDASAVAQLAEAESSRGEGAASRAQGGHTQSAEQKRFAIMDALKETGRAKRQSAASVAGKSAGNSTVAGVHFAEDAEPEDDKRGPARGRGKAVTSARGVRGGGRSAEAEEAPAVKLVVDPPPGCYTSVTPGTARMNVLVPADAAGDAVVSKLMSQEEPGGVSTSTSARNTEEAEAQRKVLERKDLTPAQRTTLLVTNVMRSIMGKEAKAALRGVSPSLESARGKKGASGGGGGGGGAAGTAATPRTEMEVIEEEARALYLEDPLRYDAVIDDLVKLATAQLQGSDPSTANGSVYQKLAGLVSVKELVPIVQAAVEMEEALLQQSQPSQQQRHLQKQPQQKSGESTSEGTIGFSSAIPRPGRSPTLSEASSQRHTSVPPLAAAGVVAVPEQEHEGDVDVTDDSHRARGSSQVAFAMGNPSIGLAARQLEEEEARQKRMSSVGKVSFSTEEAASLDAMGGGEGNEIYSGRAARLYNRQGSSEQRVTEFDIAHGAEDERKQNGLAHAEAGADEVERILFEQMKAKLLLKLIVEQMKLLWARKEVEGREKARAALDRTLAATLSLSWEVERSRVVHVTKLVHLLDRRTSRVHGWIPFYRDDNVLVDASWMTAAPSAAESIATEMRWCREQSAAFRNTSGLTTFPTYSGPAALCATSSSRQQQQFRRQLGSPAFTGTAGCARYEHYHEPMRAYNNGDIFLSSLQLRRLHHAMCLAKRRRLLPLRLVRAPAEADRSNGLRHMLFGYRRHVILLSHLRDASDPAAREGRARALNDFAEGVDVRRKLRQTLMPFTKPAPTVSVKYLQLAPHPSLSRSGGAPPLSYESRQCALPPISQLLRRVKNGATVKVPEK